MSFLSIAHCSWLLMSTVTNDKQAMRQALLRHMMSHHTMVWSYANIPKCSFFSPMHWLFSYIFLASQCLRLYQKIKKIHKNWNKDKLLPTDHAFKPYSHIPVCNKILTCNKMFLFQFGAWEHYKYDPPHICTAVMQNTFTSFCIMPTLLFKCLQHCDL